MEPATEVAATNSSKSACADPDAELPQSAQAEFVLFVAATSVAGSHLKMQHNKLALYVHLVWTTWDRVPLLKSDIERDLYLYIRSEAERCGCQVIALNGTEDHVHLLQMPATMGVAELVQRLKGSSAHFVNHALQAREPLKWRASYAAFSVSRWDVRKISNYIKNQKEHHAQKNTIEELEVD